MSLRTFFPIDNDDLAVHALEPERVALNAGRAVLMFSPAEAVNLADSLNKAAKVCGYTAAPTTAAPAITVDDAMVDRATDAWEQYWNQNAAPFSSASNRDCLAHVLRQALGVSP